MSYRHNRRAKVRRQRAALARDGGQRITGPLARFPLDTRHLADIVSRWRPVGQRWGAVRGAPGHPMAGLRRPDGSRR